MLIPQWLVMHSLLAMIVNNWICWIWTSPRRNSTRLLSLWSFGKLAVKCTLEVLPICSQLDKNELFPTSFRSLLFMTVYVFPSIYGFEFELEFWTFSTFDWILSDSLGWCKSVNVYLVNLITFRCSCCRPFPRLLLVSS